MTAILLMLTVALSAALWWSLRGWRKAERRGVRLEAKVKAQAQENARLAGHLDAMGTVIREVNRPDAVVAATAQGIKDSILAALDPHAASGRDTPNPTAAPPLSYVGWGDDEPVDFDPDGEIIMEGALPGTPDDYTDTIPDIGIDLPPMFGGSVPEVIEP